MAISEGVGDRKGGVFDATVFVFDAVQSVKSTTVFIVCGEEMDDYDWKIRLYESFGDDISLLLLLCMNLWC